MIPEDESLRAKQLRCLERVGELRILFRLKRAI